MESVWLLAIISVPLVFLGRNWGEWSSVIGSFELPKIALLRTLVGTLFSLWLLEMVVEDRRSPVAVVEYGKALLRPGDWANNLAGWLRGRPASWVYLAVALYLATTLLSTALSASFSVSLWGDVPGQDSYSTYTVAGYLLLFGVIATHLRTQAQLKRLLGAITIMAVLVAGYAIFQNYGYDFLDLREPFNTNRSSSTMGNAIFAGSLLLMTIPVCLATATATLDGPIRRLAFWVRLGLWVSVLTILLLGLIFTLSRGPWLGTGVALAVFGVGSILVAGWRPFMRAAIVFGVSSLITVAIIQIPEQGDSPSEVGPSASAAVTQRVTASAGPVGVAGLDGRIRIWRASRNLVFDHPWYEFDSLPVGFVRPLIGYGPEVFRSAYLLESKPTTAAFLPGEAAHAHNFFIHQTVEQGILGLITAAGLYLIPLLVGSYIFLRRRSRYSTVSRLLLVGLLAAFAGRMLEQLVGVARVSDLTLFWVLLAAYAGMIGLAESSGEVLGAGRPPGQLSDPSPPTDGQVALEQRATWQRAAILISAVFLISGVPTLTWFKSIDYVRAAVSADRGAEQFREGDLSASLDSMDRAIDLAPDVSTYYSKRTSIYAALRASPNQFEGIECSARPDSQSHEICFSEKIGSGIRDWLGRRPNNVHARVSAASSAFELGLSSGDTGLIEEGIQRYREATQMVPDSFILWNELARAHIQAEQPEVALEVLESSLLVTSGTDRSYFAFLIQADIYKDTGQSQRALNKLQEAIDLHHRPHEAFQERGIIFADLGRFQEALGEFDEALQLADNVANYHFNRGSTYYTLGRFSSAIRDLDEAIRLEETFTEAYNNRGLALLGLDETELALEDFEQAIFLRPDYALAFNNKGLALSRLERFELALKNFDEAILLDPQLATAYSNRALTHTVLENDAAAEEDIAAAVALGLDEQFLREEVGRAKIR